MEGDFGGLEWFKKQVCRRNDGLNNNKCLEGNGSMCMVSLGFGG